MCFGVLSVQEWEARATEAHMRVCATVPPHVARLWATGNAHGGLGV